MVNLENKVIGELLLPFLFPPSFICLLLYVHSFMYLFILQQKYFHITKRQGVKVSINK